MIEYTLLTKLFVCLVIGFLGTPLLIGFFFFFFLPTVRFINRQLKSFTQVHSLEPIDQSLSEIKELLKTGPVKSIVGGEGIELKAEGEEIEISAVGSTVELEERIKDLLEAHEIHSQERFADVLKSNTEVFKQICWKLDEMDKQNAILDRVLHFSTQTDKILDKLKNLDGSIDFLRSSINDSRPQPIPIIINGNGTTSDMVSLQCPCCSADFVVSKRAVEKNSGIGSTHVYCPCCCSFTHYSELQS